ncbi:MAG: hypothetical protein EHM41_25815 [Chloroflexi bacterium]|nr:MAG: hypothetical protein EHM41_25815 [Chloroflexota bacterium]
MAVYKVCVVGGWCGNRMVMVAEHLSTLLESKGYMCKVFHHSVWDNPSDPPKANLILQLLPAFTREQAGCPVITIKPLLVDLDHPGTIEKILDQVRTDFPTQICVTELPKEHSFLRAGAD